MKRGLRWLAAAALAGILAAGPVWAEEVTIPFNKPEDIANWKSEYETWKIEDGALTQAPAIAASREAMFWRPTASYSDLDLSVEFFVVPETGAIPQVGMVYRAVGPNAYYGVQFDPREGRQSAALFRSTPERAVNSPKGAKVPTLKMGQWHKVRIVAKGAQQTVYFDDQEIISTKDATYKAGVIGFRLGNAQVKFRNLHLDGTQVKMDKPFEAPNLPFITVASDGGAGGYEGFPDICTTKSGDLVCVFYSGFKHVPSGPNEQLPKGGKISLVRSTDQGKTWSAPETIYDSPVDDHDPQITRLSDGRLVVTICSWPVRGSHRPFIIWSEDDGHTWSEGKEVEPSVAGTEVPQGPIIEEGGKLLMPTYGEITKGDKTTSAIVRISSDGGKTWPWAPKEGLKSPYEAPKEDAMVTEPCIVKLPDGKLLMLARQKMFRWESTDGGNTWKALDPMPFRGDSPNLLLTSKNILLCGIRFRGEEKTGANRGTCVAYSTDLGKTWSKPIRIAPVIGGYTGMVELPDGKIFIVYYTEGEGSDIRGAWFTADEKGLTLLPNP